MTKNLSKKWLSTLRKKNTNTNNTLTLKKKGGGRRKVTLKTGERENHSAVKLDVESEMGS